MMVTEVRYQKVISSGLSSILWFLCLLVLGDEKEVAFTPINLLRWYNRANPSLDQVPSHHKRALLTGRDPIDLKETTNSAPSQRFAWRMRSPSVHSLSSAS